MAEQLKCGKTQIQSILLKKGEIIKDFEANFCRNVKRSRAAQHEDIDNALLDWFRKARSKNILITGPMLQEKATKIAEVLQIPAEKFKASNRWLDRFKKRCGIKAKVISGESGDVREETVDSWKERLPEILEGYAPKDIWNMDETGQFFRALPNRSLVERSRNCYGGKMSKERLTCAFFVNANGGKEKPIVVEKSAKPRCFKGIRDRDELPCQYYNQCKAWMESGIMLEILSKLNRRLKRETRKIILFMDNASCHPKDLDEKYEQIKVVFFSRNTTSRLQPLGLGIIQAFKVKYYKRLLTHVVSKVDECNSASEIGKFINVLQAIRWTAMAWDEVSETTIVKCFINAGILDSEGRTNTVTTTNSDVDPFADLENELASVQDLANETNYDDSCSNTVSLRQVVDGHFDAPVCQELPDHWEDLFFQQVGWDQEQTSSTTAGEQNEDNKDDEVEEIPAAPKVSSYRAAIVAMQDALDLFEEKGIKNG